MGLEAMIYVGSFEERVRWSQVRASATDLTPVTTAPDENEAIVEAVLVRTAGWAGRIPLATALLALALYGPDATL